MVQIGRRALSNYFKMITRNRFYAKNIYFSKNEVSRTPMWTRDFLAPYHNIQIINRRLQHRNLRILLTHTPLCQFPVRAFSPSKQAMSPMRLR